ncbi:MAG: hypothetical protein ACYS5V_04160 [Planctomycetota bacterium]|jgi:hypothetical protein
MKVTYKLNGKVVSREEFLENSRGLEGGLPYCPNTYTEAKPLVSVGAGCTRHQVPGFRKFYRDAGLSGVHVRDDGALEFTSRGDRGRRGLLKRRGLIDGDGGYGDG